MQSKPLEIFTKVELRSTLFYGGIPTLASDLHVDAVEGSFRAHESGDANDRVTSEDGEFYLTPVVKGRGHRSNALLNKVEVPDRLAGEFKLMANIHSHEPQLKTFEALRRKIAKDIVPERRSGHVRPFDQAIEILEPI